MNLNVLNFRSPENFTLIKKSVFNEIGGYREFFKKSGGEDVDLLLRILKKKYKVFYRKVNFIHLSQTSFKKKLFRVYANFKTNFKNLNTFICWYWLIRKFSGFIFIIFLYNFFKKNLKK